MGLAAAALNPEVAAAGILYPFLSDFRKVMELGADAVAYEGLRYWARWFDADGAKAEEAFSKLAYIDTASFAPYVQCPVLFGNGLADEVCPPATPDAVYERLKSPQRRLFYPSSGQWEILAFDDALIAFFGKEGL